VRGELMIGEVSSGEHYDLIVHGGGGTFFDFTPSTLSDTLINRLIRLIGYPLYTKLNLALRKMLNRELISTDKRVGFGIGVGTYTSSSAKFKHNIPVLSTFDILVTRDPQSIANLQTLALDIPTKLGSDLAFLRNFWVPSSIPTKPTRGRKKVGLVLRDWHKGAMEGYLSMLHPMMESLGGLYDVSLFIFDNHEDRELIAMSEGYPRHIWEPLVSDFESYCLALADLDLLITSRAHGAMCGAILGVASVIIEIEPKLRTIHEMLPHASLLLAPHEFTLPKLHEALTLALAIDPQTILADTQKNTTLMGEIVEDILGKLS